VLKPEGRADSAAAIIGRHKGAQLQLNGDQNLSNRHLLAWLQVTGGRCCLRLLDLNSSSGFVVESLGRCESVTSDGPFFARVGAYTLIFLPLDGVPLPEDADEAWRRLPPTTFVDRRDVGRRRRSAGAASTRGCTTIIAMPQPTTCVTSSEDASEQPAGVLVVAGDSGNRQFVVSWELLERGLILGRDSRCDVATSLFSKNVQVSRVHALLLAESGVIHVVDLGSTNGTKLNGRRVRVATLPREALLKLGPGGDVVWKQQ
jgi:hypothetical protein